MHISSLILQSCRLRGNVCVCTIFAQPACDQVITLLLWLRIISRNHVQTHAPLLFFSFFNASGLLLLLLRHKRPLGLKNKRDLIPELRAAVVSPPSEWISDTIRKYFTKLQRKHFLRMIIVPQTVCRCIKCRQIRDNSMIAFKTLEKWF